MKAKFILAAVAFLSIATISAEAQTGKAKRQHHRIKQGVKSGELTHAEAKNLRNDQKEIREEKKEAKADGIVTPAERKELRKAKRKESREIYRKKHNKRDRN
jgi:hypothetical protein